MRQETLARIRLFGRSLQLVVAAAVGRTDWLVVAVVVAAVRRRAVEVRLRSVKETRAEAEPVIRAAVVVAADQQAVQEYFLRPTKQEMAETVRQVRSPAKASYMRPEEEEAAPPVSPLARAAPLELAAEAHNGAAQRQLLVPRTLVAVAAVRMPPMKKVTTIRLAQEQAALW
jgi:hypothetical protein